MCRYSQRSSNLDLPPALRSALEKGEIVIFCGAGISMLAPSHLPSWRTFNETLLQVAKQVTLSSFPEIDGRAREAITNLNLQRFKVETFSERIVESFAGFSYFQLLEVLESDRTNANHLAIAELARAGRLRAVVTTNFDTLLERAFREKGLKLQVISAREDIPSVHGSGDYTLLKIHGSVTAHTSLVDTVRQKVRGLPMAFRALLATMFRDLHVVVMGFSGADLHFGNDYLALSSVALGGPGLTWVVRPGSTVLPKVAETVLRVGSGGCILEADLPAFFARLGVAVETPSDADAKLVCQAAEVGMQSSMHAFFQRAHIGPYGAAVLCCRLLRDIGDAEVVNRLYEVFATSVALNRTEVPISGGAMFRWLGLHDLELGRFEAGERWLMRELAFHDALLTASREPTPETRLENRQNLGAIWNNLAICSRHMGNLEEALVRVQRAEQLVSDRENRHVLSRVLFTAADIADAASEGADDVLLKLRRARAFAMEAGSVMTLAETSLKEAVILISIFELDGALRSLREGRPYIRLTGKLTLEVQAAQHLATVARLRQKNAVGLEVLRRMRLVCIRQGAPAYAASVVLHATELFGTCPEIRPALLMEIETVRNLSPETTATATLLKDALLSGKFDGSSPVRFRRFGFSEVELSIRQQIVALSFAGRYERLPERWEQLCHIKYGDGKFPRLASLAQDFRTAARRASLREAQFSAVNYLGIARERTGDLAGARELYLDALGDALPPNPQLTAFLKHNLALVEMRQGQLDRAEVLLREALASNLARDDDDTAANNIRFLMEVEARRGGLEKAIALHDASEDIIVRAKNPVIRPLLAQARRLLVQQRDRGSLLTSLFVPPPRQRSDITREAIRAQREELTAPGDLGNLGIVALEAGFLEEAAELVGAAESGYAAAGDLLGRSRCLSNRADIAGVRQHWQEAIDLVEQAIAIRHSLSDEDGEILNGATLAMLRHQNGEDEAAIAAAEQVMILSKETVPAKPQVKALLAMMGARARRGEILEAQDAARRVLEITSESGLQEFQTILPEVQKIANVKPVIPSRGLISPLHKAMLEAERMQRAGDWQDALKLIEAIDVQAMNPLEVARFHATRGNILRAGGKFAASADEFAAAIPIFRQAGQEELALQAEHHRAVSLRLDDQLEEAEAILRDLWARASVATIKAMAGQSLANIFLIQAKELGGIAKTKKIQETRALLNEMRGLPELNDEVRGQIELTAATMEWLASDIASAVGRQEQARAYFLRCNSHHLDLCEKLLAQRRAELQKQLSSSSPLGEVPPSPSA
jgi:tetratricopeptide (TPR) repeat protein